MCALMLPPRRVGEPPALPAATIVVEVRLECRDKLLATGGGLDRIPRTLRFRLCQRSADAWQLLRQLRQLPRCSVRFKHCVVVALSEFSQQKLPVHADLGPELRKRPDDRR